MGRQKKYNRDEVLKKAMSLFWQRGFTDTGLQDLEKATGVNKSGLYAEFKDKDDIFLASLRYYYANRGSEKVLSKEPFGWDNIVSFFKLVSLGWEGEKGCFGVNSMRELNNLPPEAQEVVNESRVYLKWLFQKNIMAEHPKISSGALAEIMVTFFSGFCIEQNIEKNDDSRLREIEDFIEIMRAK